MYSEILVIVSCRFLKFLHYLCFWGQRILWWHSYWATMGDLKNSGHLLVQEVYKVTQTFVPWQKSSIFLSSRAKVAGRSHDQCFIVNFIVMSRNVTSCHVMPRHVMSCHVMSRHAMSCHVMSRHVTSCYVMSRHFTSCHVMPCQARHATSCHLMSRHHVMSRHVMLCHVMLRHATPCHVMSRHVTSCHVESRGTVTRPTLHCQLNFSTHN